MDMELGPDGALYVLEYGDGFFSGNPDAQLARIDFVRGNYTPVPQVAATPTTSPAPGEPFQFGQQVTFQVTVTDDVPVDCSTVTVGYILGHEEHGHPLWSTAGCTGTITTFIDSGHAGAGNLSAVFVASHTDTPEDPDVPPLTGCAEVVLVPNPRTPISWGRRLHPELPAHLHVPGRCE
jgi:hypothetical protein